MRSYLSLRHGATREGRRFTRRAGIVVLRLTLCAFVAYKVADASLDLDFIPGSWVRRAVW